MWCSVTSWMGILSFLTDNLHCIGSQWWHTEHASCPFVLFASTSVAVPRTTPTLMGMRWMYMWCKPSRPEPRPPNSCSPPTTSSPHEMGSPLSPVHKTSWPRPIYWPVETSFWIVPSLHVWRPTGWVIRHALSYPFLPYSSPHSCGPVSRWCSSYYSPTHGFMFNSTCKLRPVRTLVLANTGMRRKGMWPCSTPATCLVGLIKRCWVVGQKMVSLPDFTHWPMGSTPPMSWVELPS